MVLQGYYLAFFLLLQSGGDAIIELKQPITKALHPAQFSSLDSCKEYGRKLTKQSYVDDGHITFTCTPMYIVRGQK